MIRTETHGRVLRVTLAEPNRLNALSDAMLAALTGELDRIRRTPRSRPWSSPPKARLSARATTCAKCRPPAPRPTVAPPPSATYSTAAPA